MNWISTKEQLPKHGRTILILVYKEFEDIEDTEYDLSEICIGYYDDTQGMFKATEIDTNDSGHFCTGLCPFWMLIPDPPMRKNDLHEKFAKILQSMTALDSLIDINENNEYTLKILKKCKSQLECEREELFTILHGHKPNWNEITPVVTFNNTQPKESKLDITDKYVYLDSEL